MANRYWVGGSTTWNATAGTKWAATSGGAGGQSVPTASDDVFFDGASGAAFVSLGTGNPTCRNLTCTGFVGTIDNGGGGGLTVNGNLVNGAGMTWNNFDATNELYLGASGSITTAGGTLPRFRVAVGVTATLADAFNGSGQFFCEGTFTTNNFNFTAGTFSLASGATVNMGSSLFTLNGAGTTTGSWTASTGSTVNAGTSTIKSTASTGSVQCDFGGKTYNIVWFDRGANANFIRIDGSSTFGTFRDTGTVAHEIRFLNSSTQTITNWLVSGSAGQLITIRSTGSSSTHNLVKAGGGVVSSDYLAIQYSLASPGSTWYAGANSTNITGNTGWIFTPPPALPSVKTFNGLANASIKTVEGLAIASVKSINGLS